MNCEFAYDLAYERKSKFFELCVTRSENKRHATVVVGIAKPKNLSSFVSSNAEQSIFVDNLMEGSFWVHP